MLKYLVLLLGVVPIFGCTAELDCAEAVTTRDMEQCMQVDVSTVKADLDLYLAEIRNHQLTDELDAQAFDLAQSAWEAFVEADCKAAYQHYADGSIRNLVFGSCQLDNYRHRMARLWMTYLQNTFTQLPDPTAQ